YAGALADLAVLLSRVAIEQRVPGARPSDDPLAADISRLAGMLHPDAVQLFYSVAVHSRGELSLAPDEYAGFVMACLRMLALCGQAGPVTEARPPTPGAAQPAGAPAAAPPVAAAAAPAPQARAPAAPAPDAADTAKAAGAAARATPDPQGTGSLP